MDGHTNDSICMDTRMDWEREHEHMCNALASVLILVLAMLSSTPLQSARVHDEDLWLPRHAVAFLAVVEVLEALGVEAAAGEALQAGLVAVRAGVHYKRC